MFNSLVSLEESKYTKIDPQVIKDLNLSDTFELLLSLSNGQESIIGSLCQDVETIEYRQAILKDFVKYPDLLEELITHLKAFEHFRHPFENELYKSSKLYYLIELLIIVEASVECLEELYQTLCYYKIEAKGLLDLKTSVSKMMATNYYKKMKTDMKAIRYIFTGIKSIEVSVNMTTGMRPYEAQVTKVNEYSYRYPKAFRSVSDTLIGVDQFLGHRIIRYMAVFPVEKVHLDLLEEIEFALKEHKSILKDFIRTYNKVDSTPFLKLYEEATFYYASLKMIQDVRKSELPLCWPTIKDHEARCLSVTKGYNYHLAKCMKLDKTFDHMVTNDFNLDDHGRLVILTGSNRGGKTTFTQLVGQLHIFAQLGLPLPASHCTLSLVDQIITHFPMIEKESVDYGKFGRECLEFSKHFKTMTKYSLLLMNESFAGTSHLESLEVAGEVIKAVKYLGPKTVFNTHLHELGKRVEELNITIANDSIAKSYVVGDVTGDRIYKIYEAPPKGYSQALEIAKSFGVTFEQLRTKVRR